MVVCFFWFLVHYVFGSFLPCFHAPLLGLVFVNCLCFSGHVCVICFPKDLDEIPVNFKERAAITELRGFVWAACHEKLKRNCLSERPGVAGVSLAGYLRAVPLAGFLLIQFSNWFGSGCPLFFYLKVCRAVRGLISCGANLRRLT